MNDDSSKRGDFRNQRNKQFQQYCTVRREIANVRDKGNTEKRPLKIIAGGIIHQMFNKSVYIEITRITGITEDKM